MPTLEEIKAAGAKCGAHLDSRKSATWIYTCIAEPKIGFVDVLDRKTSKTTRRFIVDDIDDSFDTLEAAYEALTKLEQSS